MRTLELFVAAALLGCCTAFYDKGSSVVTLDPSNFDAMVLGSEDLWLVEFFAPWCGHCKRLTPEWEKAANDLKGTKIHIAAVDADKHRDLGSRFHVQGFPTIKVFGEDKSNPTNYEGQRQASGIVQFARKQWKAIENKRNGVTEEEAGGEEEVQKPQSAFYDNTDVIELNDAMIDSDVANSKEPWLIEFYAPWCGHCKNLSPEWKKAATNLLGSVKLGAVDATEHRKWSDKFKVQGFPTIKFIPPGGIENPEDYNGGRTADAITEYGLKKAELYPSGPIQVNQIENDAALESLCGQKTLCIIFFVPHVADTGASGRNALIEKFSDIAGKVRSRNVALGWVVGGEHEGFERGFNIFATYPTFAAMNYKNLRAATFKGPFTTDAIVASIKKILEGKTAISQLKSVPKMREGVPLWNGQDYVPPHDDE